MRDLGRALLSKMDLVIDNWIEAVRQDEDIDSNKKLTYESIRDSLPDLLKAVATLLTRTLSDNQPEEVEEKSEEHGVDRANQGYDVLEIMREYHLLRQIIFSILEPDLLSGSPMEILQAIQLIDKTLDEVIAVSVESYIEMRLQELEQIRARLILTNQELNRLIQTQKDNLSHLAHELKNPLSSMMGFSSLLLQREQNSDISSSTPNLKIVERILNGGEQLLRLINDALEISRHESDQIELDLEQVDVQSLVERVVETLEPSARLKNLKVQVEIDDAPRQVRTDALRIQQILVNLASNALRYTDTGTIHITCRVNDDHFWMIAVSDTGRGISPEDQQKIFQPYFRAGLEEDYLPESTGLGLAIVEKLVKLLGGEIELVSQPGEGSTFTIIFPLLIEDIN
ncbi:MAG: ATP-binding protein [Microcoleaceae cyanobacterium]